MCVTNRRLLDHESPFQYVHYERRVEEVASLPVPQPCRYRLVDTAVKPHRVTTGAQRQPVEIDPGLKFSMGSRHGLRRGTAARRVL